MTSDSLDRVAQPVAPLCPRHSRIDSLLVRVGIGDRDAFASLYDSLSQTVYTMSVRRGIEPGLSAEVTQDVFLRAWRQAGSYQPTAGSAWSWIHAIALEAIGGLADDSRRGPLLTRRRSV